MISFVGFPSTTTEQATTSGIDNTHGRGYSFRDYPRITVISNVVKFCPFLNYHITLVEVSILYNAL